MAEPLRLRSGGDRSVLLSQFAKHKQSVSTNALMGMGLWLLLWLGYNTSPVYLADPHFPANATVLIHGVRAFFPMLAGWFAFLVIFARFERLTPWLVGPLGLILLYTVAGLSSSATLSPDPLDALYYGANYLAIVLVLLAIVLVDDPLPDLRKVLNLTWIVGTIITICLLGAIPFLGTWASVEVEDTPVGVRAYPQVRQIMGMSGTRNTGFARYAAISALVALPRLMRKGNLAVRTLWGILFAASLYALVISNGRTETLGFVGCVVVVLFAERAKRMVNILVGTAAAILLGLWGFYSGFYRYITRSGPIDLTLTGRTLVWSKGWRLLEDSPWVGFGFQGDRYFLDKHMHNAYLHVLFQSGYLGGVAILVALLIVWYYIIKYYFIIPPADKSLIPAEVPAVFLFVTFSSVTESTFAYFSAAWLLSAPIVAYVLALDRHMRRARARAAWEKILRWRLAKVDVPAEAPPEGINVVVPSAGVGVEHWEPRQPVASKEDISYSSDPSWLSADKGTTSEHDSTEVQPQVGFPVPGDRTGLRPEYPSAKRKRGGRSNRGRHRHKDE